MTSLKIGRPSVNQRRVLKLFNDKKEIMKMNINIEKSFHKDVKRYALEHDITVTELIHKSLQEYMKK